VIRFTLLLAIASVACRSSDRPPASTGSATPAPVAAPPDLRLPAIARPTHQDVDLVIDPTREDFTGRITTELELLAPTRTLWLNGDELDVTDATINIGGERITATATAPKKGYLGLTFTKDLAPGKATLAIAYRGKMHAGDGDGIYTAKEAGASYAFTQFEPTAARQAFPCFDEPSYKTPWRLTLHVDTSLVALSNTPVATETDEPGGKKAVRFAETRPLPSYLVAFAVGPFEAVPAGTTRSGAPIRIVVPRGRTGDVAYAVQSTKRILDALEDYFGSPYMYPKLDLVAVSVFNLGAMENPGLITVRQDTLLTRPEDRTPARDEAYASVAAHEIAHQWFGDEVTIAWWDDTWLKESFASWMAAKLVAQLEPAWQGDLAMVGARAAVMATDSLENARTIRQPIDSANDITNAFDGITYDKGQAVLTMMERWLTPEVFQKGVRAYLAEHAGGNASYADFVRAMNAASGRDIKPLFDSFVLQSGVPLLSVELRCTAGAPATLELAQRRYVPTGSEIDPKRTWQLPVCVRWGAGVSAGRDCTLLTAATGELALSAPSCPDWVLPDEGELGYYRMLPRGDLLAHLLAVAPRALTPAERIGLVGDVDALVASGDVPPGVALQLVADLAGEQSRYLADASIEVVAGIHDMVSDRLRPNYERFIRRLYQARAHELGWQSARGDSDDVKRLRPVLLSLVASKGKDRELIAQATALAWKWLDDHSAVQPELVDTVLEIAGRFGDQKLFDRLHAAAKQSTDSDERERLLTTMGQFIDPKLVAQAQAISITNEFDIHDSHALLHGGLHDPHTRAAALEFVEKHYDTISSRLPELYRPYLVAVVALVCDSSRKRELEAFFAPRISKLDGGPRIMAQQFEEMELCSAKRKAEQPGVEAFLARQ
jgi:alanyl aminopeptidase